MDIPQQIHPMGIETDVVVDSWPTGIQDTVYDSGDVFRCGIRLGSAFVESGSASVEVTVSRAQLCGDLVATRFDLLASFCENGCADLSWSDEA